MRFGRAPSCSRLSRECCSPATREPKPVAGKQSGVIVGKVLKVYNNFWVAIKPANGGMIEGFALNFPPEKFKQSHDLIKTLQPGDTVAIKYATDFERHRILQMEVKAQPKASK
jgi:hypothetical protein